jgi:predicted HTH domain antitoxin
MQQEKPIKPQRMQIDRVYQITVYRSPHVILSEAAKQAAKSKNLFLSVL